MSTPGLYRATTAIEPPDMRPATFDDFPAMRRLESQFFFDVLPDDERRRLFEDNPLWPQLARHWPVGWVLEDVTGAIVGTVTNVPSAYMFRGEQKICGNGLGWTTSADYRGYAALLMDEYFLQPHADLVVGTTVGVDSTSIWRAYGSPVPLGDWSRIAYAVTDRRAFAREALAMRRLPSILAGPTAVALGIAEKFTTRSLLPAPRGVDIVENRGFDARFDAFWSELREQNHDKLLAVRDRATLEWHYGLPLRSKRLWVYTAERRGRLCAYCMVKEHERREGIHSMKVVDYQTVDSAVDLLPGLLRAAAARCAGEGNSVLEHEGCDIPKTRSFDRFAPHRMAKATWPFYFRAADPSLAAELVHPDAWDPSEYDGDASYT